MSIENKTEFILEMRGLCVDGYSNEGWMPILKGIDLTLRRGEILGLIGESGAGKSTLGAAAMGYVRDGTRFSSGSVNFDGIELTFASEAQ